MRTFPAILLLPAVLAAAVPARAEAPAPAPAAKPAAAPLDAPTRAALDDLIRDITPWGKSEIILKAVEAQNAKKVPLAKIQETDREWIAGRADAEVRSVLSNACAVELKIAAGASLPFLESFVMDDQGALVCATNRTSDYWQGDEAKWQKTFPTGSTFIDEPKYDESAKLTMIQVSFPILRNGKPVGALTVGMSTDALKVRGVTR